MTIENVEDLTFDELRERYSRLSDTFKRLQYDYNGLMQSLDNALNRETRVSRELRALEKKLNTHIPDWELVLSMKEAGVKKGF